MNIEDIPYGYAYCYATPNQCPDSPHCLRHHAACMNEEVLPDPPEAVCCITPTYVERVAKGEPCRHFRSDEPLRYARGMSKVFDAVPRKQYPSVRNRVINCFSCERIFYYAQKGEQLISPAQQERIAAIFEQMGLATPPFDRYELRPNWDA